MRQSVRRVTSALVLTTLVLAGPVGSVGAARAAELPAPGCAPTAAGMPDVVHLGTVTDLDGDGRGDQIFLGYYSDVREPLVGVHTASGATVTTPFSTASPLEEAVTGGRLGDGTAVVLLDVGREVQVFALRDCHLVQTVAAEDDDLNTAGQRFVLDRDNRRGLGTGAACRSVQGDLRLFVYRATTDSQRASGSYMIERRQVLFEDGGLRARLGSWQTRSEGSSAADPLVDLTTRVTCASAAERAWPVGGEAWFAYQAEPGASPLAGSGRLVSPESEVDVREFEQRLIVDAQTPGFPGLSVRLELARAHGAALRQGSYPEVRGSQRNPDHAFPEIRLISDGIGCGDDEASVRIDRLDRDDTGHLTALDLSLDHRCSPSSPPLRAEVHFRAPEVDSN